MNKSKVPLTPEEVQERLKEAHEQLRETTDRLREAQEQTVKIARERTAAALEIANTRMPPGLFWRLVSAIFGIPLVLFLVFWEGVPPYTALPFAGGIAICAVIGAGEYFRALRAHGYHPSEWVAFLAIATLQFAAWGVSRDTVTQLLPALFALLVLVTMMHQILRRDPELVPNQPVRNLGVTFFGVVYIGWLISYLIFLRSLAGTVTVFPFSQPLPRGAWLVLYVFFVTWMTDSGAYFVGSWFARRDLGTPLAPRLSPKKTRQGFWGGIVFALLSSLVWGVWIGIPFVHCLLLGPLLGVLGQVGDLCESALKRDLGVKDFGGILPGHGGVLDRFDSLLFTAPVAYYYLKFFL
jgi:phosphatidate cytidylyltransferase